MINFIKAKKRHTKYFYKLSREVKIKELNKINANANDEAKNSKDKE